MNWILVSFVMIGWMGGNFESGNSPWAKPALSWNFGSSDAGILHVQSTDPENPDTGESNAIGGESQNWGALIVFAVGIALFIVAYLVFRQTPAPKKKKRKKF